MKTSDKFDLVLKSLFLVKKDLKEISKGADNPYFNSKYADLNSHLDGIEPLLEKNGMILLQPVCRDEDGDYVESIIYHESGQWMSSSMTLFNTPDMQKAGSAVTYARRYTLGALFSVKTVDDDGEASMGRTNSYKKINNYKPKAKPAPKAEAKSEKPKEVKPFTRPQAKEKSNGILM